MSSGEAIIINNSEPVITNSHFFRNGIAIKVDGFGNSPQISNNIFEEDSFAPIQIALGTTPAFSNNTYTNNTYRAIAIVTKTYTDPSYQLSRRNVAGIQNIPYIIGGDMSLSASSTWTIDPGVVIKFLSLIHI